MLKKQESLISDFLEILRITGINIARDGISMSSHCAPHQRPQGHYGNASVYVFMLDDLCLKVGCVPGRKPTSRLHNHYNPNTANHLAAKILNGKQRIKEKLSDSDRVEIDKLSTESIASWMEERLSLYCFHFRRDTSECVIRFFEAFLHCKMNPLFEGTQTATQHTTMTSARQTSS